MPKILSWNSFLTALVSVSIRPRSICNSSASVRTFGLASDFAHASLIVRLMSSIASGGNGCGFVISDLSSASISSSFLFRRATVISPSDQIAFQSHECANPDQANRYRHWLVEWLLLPRGILRDGCCWLGCVASNRQLDQIVPEALLCLARPQPVLVHDSDGRIDRHHVASDEAFALRFLLHVQLAQALTRS